VLLVQKRHQTGDAAKRRRQSRRQHGRHHSGFAQVAANLREHIEKETRDDAAEDHFLHAAETKEPQATAPANSTIDAR
jgi:hypothetical protein